MKTKILKKAMNKEYCGETRFDFLDKEELIMIYKAMEEYHQYKLKLLNILVVSNRFNSFQMAIWFHNNYEAIAKEVGWQTQDKCKVEFKDLPEQNKQVMIKVCERWLNGC